MKRPAYPPSWVDDIDGKKEDARQNWDPDAPYDILSHSFSPNDNINAIETRRVESRDKIWFGKIFLLPALRISQSGEESKCRKSER